MTDHELSVRTIVPVTIENGETARFVSFYGLSDGREHVALLFKEGNKIKDPLVRIHSACLTGDIFGSNRCDCRYQLKDAINRLSKEGGILLYLQQEGRGIGLYNKLDAYKLQIEEGLDTYEANKRMGFEMDERSYNAAAEMLEAMGVMQVKLISNNPDKAEQLERQGIKVVERVPTIVHANEANVNYLKAKKEIAGHLIDFTDEDQKKRP